VFYETEIKPTFLTDLELSYQVNKSLTLSLGANNLFNKYPDQINAQLLAEQRANLDNTAVTIYPSFSPYGINGGYYYARVGLKF